MLLTILVFILMFGLLIFIHEFGHYIVAKKNGIKVEQFAFGFGPRIFSIQGKETLFEINLIPLGGYVKLSDEYEKKPVWQRTQVIVAGVLMNLFLGIFLFFVAYGIVGREVIVDEYNKQYLVTPEEISIVITEIVEDSPAEDTLEGGDIILNFYTIEDFQEYIQRHPEEEISLSILRNQEEVEIEIVPNLQGYIGVGLIKVGVDEYNKQYLVAPEEISIVITEIMKGSPADDKLKPGDIILNFYTIEDFQEYIQRHPEEEISLSILRNQEEIEVKIVPGVRGYMGVRLINTGIVRYPLDKAFLNTFDLLFFFVEIHFVFFRDLITGEIEQPGEYVGGPVQIFQVVDQVIPRGAGTVLILIGLISVLLAFINILPFPPLDGGHLMFLTIEGIRKKPVSKKIQNTTNTIGFILLMLLFVIITINDIRGLL